MSNPTPQQLQAARDKGFKTAAKHLPPAVADNLHKAYVPLADAREARRTTKREGFRARVIAAVGK